MHLTILIVFLFFNIVHVGFCNLLLCILIQTCFYHFNDYLYQYECRIPTFMCLAKSFAHLHLSPLKSCNFLQIKHKTMINTIGVVFLSLHKTMTNTIGVVFLSLHKTMTNTIGVVFLSFVSVLKQLSSRWKKILKLTLNTGQVMFSWEIYYYWPLNSVDKSLVKYRFSLHNLLCY